MASKKIAKHEECLFLSEKTWNKFEIWTNRDSDQSGKKLITRFYSVFKVSWIWSLSMPSKSQLRTSCVKHQSIWPQNFDNCLARRKRYVNKSPSGTQVTLSERLSEADQRLSIDTANKMRSLTSLCSINTLPQITENESKRITEIDRWSHTKQGLN